MRHKRASYPGQYRDTGSRLHRLSPATKVAIGWLLSLGALLATPSCAIALALVCALVYALARLEPAVLRQDAFLVAIQAPLVVAVFLCRDGIGGLAPALLVSLRLSLASLPGLWVQRTTRAADLGNVLSRVLPARLAFLLTMTLRFLPLIARDAREIYALQILRGAAVRPRDLVNPLNWREACHSVAIPLVIRTLHLADQVSVAARQRGVETATCPPRIVAHSAPVERPGDGSLTGAIPWCEK